MITTLAKYTARYTSRAARGTTNIAKSVPGQAARATKATGGYLKNVATTASSEWKKEFAKRDTA